MDRNYIDAHHVVARYLADQLPDAEREAFEAYFLLHPDMVQEIEAAARFKAGLRQLRQMGRLDDAPQARRWYRKPLYAAAAAALLATGVMYTVPRLPEMQPVLTASRVALRAWSGRPLALGGTYVIVRTRGVPYDADFELPHRDQVVELRIVPEYVAIPARYRLVLSSITPDDALRKVAEVGALAPGSDSAVSIFLNGARLEPGRYHLLLSADNDTGTNDGRSAFRIRIRDSHR